ncbi:hypothetical protein MMC20_000936 [Loxospora ochrophaea]|nr:hypothetical protein [Loxospora ochrophaea]
MVPFTDFGLFSCNTYDNYGNYYQNCSSPWYSYGRWILFAAILLGAFVFFLVLALISARRRRRMGARPYYGTGFLAGRPPPGHGPAQYTGAQPQPSPYYGNQGSNGGPPAYAPTQGYYGNEPQNQGYFGGQQSGIELQQPQGTYQPQREPVYNAPEGAPPVKKDGDGIIR